MSTIEYYLRQLDYYRKLLIKNLRDFGVECSDDETYNNLIPKIYSLSSSGEVVVDNLQLRYYTGSAEDIQYIFDHTVEAVKQTNLSGKFYMVTNMTHLPLNKLNFDKSTSGINHMFGPPSSYLTSYTTPPVISIDATGCDLSNDVSDPKNGYVSRQTNNKYDYYSVLETVDFSNASLGNSAFRYFTGTGVAPNLSNLILDNAVFKSNIITCLFASPYSSYENDTIKSIDLSEMVYEKPISAIYHSFCGLPELEQIDLGSIEFADTVEFTAVDASHTNIINSSTSNMNNCFRDLNKLKTFPIPLNKLEGKTVNAIQVLGLQSYEDDLIFPEITITSNLPLVLYRLYKVSKCDISKLNFSYDGPISFAYVFCGMGSSLDDDKLENAELIGFDELISSVVVSSLKSAFASNKLLPKDVYTLPSLTVDTANTQAIFESLFSGTPVEEIRIVNPITLSENSTRVFSLNSLISSNSFVKKLVIDLGRTKCASANYIISNCPALEELYMSIDSCDINDNDSYISFTYLTSSNNVNLKKMTFKDMRISGGFYTQSSNGSSYKTYYPGLELLVFDNCVLSGFTSLKGVFQQLRSSTLEIVGLDMGLINNVSNTFYSASNLVELTLPSGLGKAYTQKTSNYSNYMLSLYSSSKISKESVLRLIDGVYDLNLTYDVANGGTLYTQQIKLYSTVKNLLTPEEIAIATNKGWTIV